MNFATAIRDVNPSRLVVFSSLLIFSIIFGRRLDNIIEWNYWIVFLPIWCWKLLAISGACVGFTVWLRHPNFRNEAAIQFKSMLIYGALNAVLMMFEILVCAKTDATLRILWVLVFLPLLVLSVVSIGLCVWSARHEKPFEMELFFSANLLLFVFIPIKLDGFVSWSWAVVLIPLWIVMAVTIVAVLYGVILAAFLWRSPDVNPAQKRASLSVAVGYACAVVPLLVFEILLTGKLDESTNTSTATSGSYSSMSYSSIFAVLDLALCALVCTSFTARGSNQWWFGIRKEFGQFVLDTCPLLQEYGNVEYKFPESMVSRVRRPPRRPPRRTQRTGSLILARGGGAMRFDLAALSGSDLDVATPSSVTFSDLHAFGFDEPLAVAHPNVASVNPHDSANVSSMSRSPPVNVSHVEAESRRRRSRTQPQHAVPSGTVGRSQSLGVSSGVSGRSGRRDRRAPLSLTSSANPRAEEVGGPRTSSRSGRLRNLFHSTVTTQAQREQLRQLERVQRELQRSGELRSVLGLRPARPLEEAAAPVADNPSASEAARVLPSSEAVSRASTSQRRRSDDAVIELDADPVPERVSLTRTPSLRVSGSVASVPRTLVGASVGAAYSVDERRSNPSLTSRANTSRLRVGVCNTPVLLHVDVHSSIDTSLNLPGPAPPPDSPVSPQRPAILPPEATPPPSTPPNELACVLSPRTDSRRSSDASLHDSPVTAALLPQSAPASDFAEPARRTPPNPSPNVNNSQLSVPPPTYAAAQHSPALVPLSVTPPPYSPNNRPPPPLQPAADLPQAPVGSRFFASISRHLRSHSGGSRTASKKQRFADERKNSVTQDWLVSSAPLARSIYTPD